MTPAEITRLRLHRQQVSATVFTHAKDLVTYMGALQAQDEAMCKWAVGIRINNTGIKKVETALDKGEILRTHVLRPTWHLVAAQDIYWMLELTAPQIKRGMGSRHKELELTPTTLTKSRKIIEKLLDKNDFVTRNQIADVFAAAKIHTNDNRLSHLLFMCELDGVMASGPLDNGKHTYALLEKRVEKKKLLPREEALAELALRYFTSHGPAALPDFAWWAGLNLGDARKGLDSVKTKLAEIKTGDTSYYMASDSQKTPAKKNEVFFLPAYDEYLISYKNRSAALKKQHQANALSTNGIFFPLIVVDGQAAGTWKRSFKKDDVLVETKFFAAPPVALKPYIKKAATAYADFMGKKLVM
jgi:hypothetical protein